MRNSKTAQATVLCDTGELHPQGAVISQLGYSRSSVSQKIQALGFEEELLLSLIFLHPWSQYQPLVNRPNTGTSNMFGRFPTGRSHLLVFMALCSLWGFQVTWSQRTATIRTIMSCLVSQKDFKSHDIRNIIFTRPKIKFLTAVSKPNYAGVGGSRGNII